MAKILEFNDTIEYKLSKAEEFYDLAYYEDALPMLFDVLKKDSDNKAAKMLTARIYAEMDQYDLSSEAYFSVLVSEDDTEAVRGVLTNLYCQNEMDAAEFYQKKYAVDYDIFEFFKNEAFLPYSDDDDDGEEEPQKKRRLSLVVSKETKDGENKIEKGGYPEAGEYARYGCAEGEAYNFKELVQQLIDNVGEAENDGQNFGAAGKQQRFKQIYPLTNKECDEHINKAFKYFSSGHPEESIRTLDKIIEKNGRYYYLAQKNKSMCYLALNRLASMKASAEIALKGLPDDFTLKCYYYISLKLLEEYEAADKLFAEILKLKPSDAVEYMVLLDACRLALNHRGILECLEIILSEFPYQPQFMLLKGKAEYNLGRKKAARAAFLTVMKMYPDNYEARLMLEKIKYDDDSAMSYGEIELSIKRVKLYNEIFAKTQNARTFNSYLKTNADALRDIEFVLLNESERNVYGLTAQLYPYMKGKLGETVRRMLLKINASDFLKTTLITYYLYGSYPDKISVAADKKLIDVILPTAKWMRGHSAEVVLAADMAIADFIVKQPLPRKEILSLTTRLERLGKFIAKKTSDQGLAARFKAMTDVGVLKKVFEDITLHKVKRTPSVSLKDEEYYRYLSIIGEIEEAYEI